MKTKLLTLFLICFCTVAFSQKSKKQSRYFANTIVVDSSSTVIIPTLYDTEFFSSKKLVLSKQYYANIIFYNFVTDSAKKLFEKDTFIKKIGENNYYSYYDYKNISKPNSITDKWIFYFVKPTDYNLNGKIDDDDPFVLYISDKHGDGLKSITPENENTVSIDVFDKQGFALIKMQRDTDNDYDFDPDDTDFYYIRLDLNTLSLGKKIEVSNY